MDTDIDVDFAPEGRQKVIDYVIEKYGKECVCQIITNNAQESPSVRMVPMVLFGLPVIFAIAIENTVTFFLPFRFPFFCVSEIGLMDA